ncbi:MAG: hypothetical protein PQJ50_04215 [Spirochaetales bacterium]|nr:hypothetical protein [Spirochaetales bacterium]
MKYNLNLEYEVSRMIRTGDLSRISERRELFDEPQGKILFASCIERVLRREFLGDGPEDNELPQESPEKAGKRSNIIPFPLPLWKEADS